MSDYELLSITIDLLSLVVALLLVYINNTKK